MIYTRAPVWAAVQVAIVLALPTATGWAEVSQSDRELVNHVLSQLLAVTEPPEDLAWPPHVDVSESDKINAFATAKSEEKSPKLIPVVTITTGMLGQVVQGDADRLAFILGHELGHIVLRHVVPKPGREPTPFVKATFTREQEYAADLKGMQLTLQAGHSHRRAIRGIQRMTELGLDYSSFEGLGVDHPSWKDRLTFLDKEQASLWKAMSAFENGVVFLLLEQYETAARCFKCVTRDFPACHEGCANLGHALLMQYCDALELEDLRQFGLGQIVCGGFYRRPTSLEAQVRGIDEELWWAAVDALKDADRLKPDQSLVVADLGLAYLLRPAGKDPGKARAYLDRAAELAQADSTLDGPARAAVLINAGVADLASGETAACAKRLDEAQSAAQAFGAERRPARPVLGLTTGLLYNRSLLRAGSTDGATRAQTVRDLEEYLTTASSASAWWTLAYERYARACGESQVAAKPEEQLRERAGRTYRAVTEIELAPGIRVALSEDTILARQRLGPGESVPVVPGTNLVRLQYAQYGVSLLANEQVLAICLEGENAPAAPLRGAGLGGQVTQLRAGMTADELERLLGDQDYDLRQLENPAVHYRFYRRLGLAVRVERGGKVQELVIAQIPDREIIGG